MRQIQTTNRVSLNYIYIYIYIYIKFREIFFSQNRHRKEKKQLINVTNTYVTNNKFYSF